MSISEADQQGGDQIKQPSNVSFPGRKSHTKNWSTNEGTKGGGRETRGYSRRDFEVRSRRAASRRLKRTSTVEMRRDRWIAWIFTREIRRMQTEVFYISKSQ